MITITTSQIKTPGGETTEVYFQNEYSEVELIIEKVTTITDINFGNAVTVQYSIDNGNTWLTYTTVVTLAIGITRWRVSDFGTATDGSIILKTT